MRETWNAHRDKLPYGERKHKQKKRKFSLTDKKVMRGLYLGAIMRIF